ncbi:MAG: HAD family hydrolase [Fimbriimonadaceae bacterium]|nr:HAD family hydrolase [Chthonomonadaceae bacterium]MCO5295972.1 HAD family hydrolase [Fimbriimonadaceae bacterium]
MMRRPIFLDRDGVLNVDITPYVTHLEKLELFPYTVEALRRLHGAGYDLYVVSNQQGVALGLTPIEEVAKIDAAIQAALAPHGFQIRKFYYCYSHDEANDPCRKPGPGMLLKAREEFGLTLEGAFFVGDKDTDMECGRAVGCRPLLVLSGVTSPEAAAELSPQPEGTFETLLEAVEYVLDDTPD